MIKQMFLLIAVVLLAASTNAQNKIDSLIKAMQGKPLDSNSLKTALLISQAYSNRNPDSSIRYAERVIQSASTNHIPSLSILAYQYKAYGNYIKGEYAHALDDYKKMYASAEKLGDKKNMAASINNQGNVYIELGNYTEAINRYKEALIFAEGIKDEYGIARGYNNIGYVYKELGEYEKATENMLIALKVFEKLSLPRETSNSYNNIAAIYSRQKNFDKALEYNIAALAIQKKNNIPMGAGISLQGIANIYAGRKQYAKALETYHEGLNIYESMKDKRQLALVYSNMGNMYNLSGNYDSSEAYYDKAIELNRQMGNARNLAAALTGNATTLISAGKLEKAKALLDSTEIINKTTNKKEDLKEYYQILSDYYAAIGNTSYALTSYKKYIEQKDSLVNEQVVKSTADLNIKYETEKKQLQIALLNKTNAIKDLEINNQKLALSKRAFELAKQQLALADANLTISNNKLEIKSKNELLLKSQLNSSITQRRLQQLNEEARLEKLELQNQRLLNAQKNYLIVTIIVFALALTVLGYSLYRRHQLRNNQRLQKVVVDEQERAARAVLQAEESERKRIARDLHDGVGQMMSAAKMNLSAIESDMVFESVEHSESFKRVLHLIDNSLSEVRTVSHSMMPNALMKDGLAAALKEFIDQIDKRVIKIQLHTEGLNKRIDENIESVLYRIVQESVSNVIKHAEAKHLDISLIRTNNGIDATIEDDGKGFNVAGMTQADGIGLKNIKSRIEFLKGQIEWNSYPQKGTLISFHVPV